MSFAGLSRPALRRQWALELHVEPVRVFDVEAAGMTAQILAGLQSAAIEFGLDRFVIPWAKCVADVIDERLVVRLTRLACEEDAVAKMEIGLFAVVVGDFHIEQVDIEVAGTRVIGDAV